MTADSQEVRFNGEKLAHADTKREYGNLFPEIIANSPLEHTGLVISIPVMGEWKNGNLLRMLKGMLSQNQRKGEAFELEFIANNGESIEDLILRDEEKWNLKRDASNRILLENNPVENYVQESLNLLKETNQTVLFLRKVIEAQKLARLLLVSPSNEDLQIQLNQLVESFSDPLQKDIMQLAVRRANSISIVVIDATHTIFTETDYQYVSLASLRTLGADIARVRFEESQHIIFCLYDADTVFADNNSVVALQTMYANQPKLNYAFSGMTNFPAGHSMAFVKDAPSENVLRTASYNTYAAHGSPQISFRLKAYNKLQEIAGWRSDGFLGDEDRDTSYRLIYYYGLLRDSLMRMSGDEVFSPTSLTADRLDGSVDSASRRSKFAEGKSRNLSTDLSRVFAFRELVTSLIDKQTDPEKLKIYADLQRARGFYRRKQEIQSMFNRTVLKTFLQAIENGYIRHAEGEVHIDTEKIMTQRGGVALAHYLNANMYLLDEVISRKENLAVMRYYLGVTTTLTEQVPTPFQLAIREFVGVICPLDELIHDGVITGIKEQVRSYYLWLVDDNRTNESHISAMHSTIAEMLALAHIYKTCFETADFLASRDTSLSTSSDDESDWPINPDKQKLTMHFGELEERLKKIRIQSDVVGTKIPRIPVS